MILLAAEVAQLEGEHALGVEEQEPADDDGDEVWDISAVLFVEIWHAQVMATWA